MVHLFLTIRRIMEQFITESFSALPTMLDRSLGDHKRIYEAIRHRDRSLAIKEMTRHMANIHTAMENLYDATSSEPSETPARRRRSVKR
jgi:DNA-binding FadR family transcriptional regulator